MMFCGCVVRSSSREHEELPQAVTELGEIPASASGGFVSCSCGSTRVALKGLPAKTVLCHCEDCRRWTGSVGQLAAWYPRAQVRVSADLVEFSKGSSRIRKCCPKCFTPLLTELVPADLMETRIPTLTPVLDAHFFCLKPMLQFRDQVPKFADLPKALGGSGLIASELSVQATAERVFTGQCLCTSVQIVVSEPEHSVFLCHCRQCQSWTGSLGSYAVLFHEKDVQIIGSLVEVEGKMACATCFSRISSKDHAGTGLIALCGGVLNSPPAVQMHLHYGQRVLSVKDRVAKFNDAPVEQGGSGTLLGKDDADPYMITITRTGRQSLGLELWCSARMCRVLRVWPGSLVSDWNQICSEDCIVQNFDRLISINGKSAASAEDIAQLDATVGTFVLVFARHTPCE
ncbi:unnamed protein product [Effrenium voratum]|uniref:CENP-V/GFA domain-containing protein n=1 Tax=Effrenium voratum TaxID=2562239 RepID=A0AA36HS23_9DINO|nr:unnamed protein product [Effrenium voratum]